MRVAVLLFLLSTTQAFAANAANSASMPALPVDGFSEAEWAAMAPQIQLCHEHYGPHAASPAKLRRCIQYGGYATMLQAESAEMHEHLARERQKIEHARREAQERNLSKEAQRALEEEHARARAAQTATARERTRQAKEAQLTTRPAAQADAERKTALVLGERLKDTAMRQVRQMHKDPDLVRFSDIRVVLDKHNTKVLAICGHASGTNSFGARVNGPWLFSTESDHVYIRGADGWPGSGLSLWSQHCR